MGDYRVGIIGCGAIFPVHAETLAALDGVCIAAICDIDETLAQQKAEQFGCAWYSDYRKMLEEANLDAVHICTPHYLHPIMAIDAANAGVNVFCEKPVSIQYDDAQRMIDAAKNNGVALGVCFQNRYNPGSRLIRSALKSGRLGAVTSVRARLNWYRPDSYFSSAAWRGTLEQEGGGVVINQAIHTLDLIRYLVGDDVAFVDATVSNRAHPTIEVEDEAVGLIGFKNGVKASFYFMIYDDCDAPVELEIRCTNGVASIMGSSAQVKYNDGTIECADGQDCSIEGKSYWGNSHNVAIARFYECLKQGMTPDIDGKEAAKTQQLVCALYQSGRGGGRVEIQ